MLPIVTLSKFVAFKNLTALKEIFFIRDFKANLKMFLCNITV